MAYLRESEVRARATQTATLLKKSAHRILTEATVSLDKGFDVFLSHSSSEPEEILLGIKQILEDLNLSVYVDKYSDPELSPDNVTPKTAAILRDRMRRSKSLLYVYSRHSQKSRWMPWELGFFDGLRGRVGVIPVTQDEEETFKGEEYLNLYPYVDTATAEGKSDQTLWINASTSRYTGLVGWIKDGRKMTDHESAV